MAAMIVQRPSPESDTRPENSSSCGSFASASAVRSSSQDAMTLPRRQTSAISAKVEVVLVVLGVAQRRGLGVDVALLLAGVRLVQDVEALRVGRHEAVLDAVVDHLHEVAGARRTAVQVALLGRRPCRCGRAWRSASPLPGASAAKIGSSRRTASASPPIIWQ